MHFPSAVAATAHRAGRPMRRTFRYGKNCFRRKPPAPVRAAARRQTDPRGTPPDCSTPDGKPLHRRLHAAPPACGRSEEHTSELQSLMRTSYAVFCWKKKAICLIVQWDDAVLFRENGRAHV